MNGIIGGSAKAFRLRTGGLLLVDSLACAPSADENNVTASCLLRIAIGDPGGVVCGSALHLEPEEASLLCQEVRSALLLDDRAEAPVVLLLDRNQGFRKVMAERFEHDAFRVVQARTGAEASEFCKSHAIDLVVADVSSLRPKPIDTVLSIRNMQSGAKVLLISGYDLSTVGFLYPGLLTSAEFLQKPFSLNAMLRLAQSVRGTNKTDQQPQAVAQSPPDTQD